MSLTRKGNLKQVFIYLGVTAFSLLFTSIYYLNSYGMTDNHLTFLFVLPLVNVLVFLFLFLFKYSPSHLANCIWNMSFPFIYVYMMLSGIYTIAKTSSNWLFIFIVLFVLGILTSIITEVATKIRNKRSFIVKN